MTNIILIIGFSILLIGFCTYRYNRLGNRITKLEKIVIDFIKTFKHHITVTDDTILEERKQKNYWKKLAIKLQKRN